MSIGNFDDGCSNVELTIKCPWRVIIKYSVENNDHHRKINI